MRVIVAGSRSLGYADTYQALEECGLDITSIVDGMCPYGPDFYALWWAEERGIPVIPYPAEWLRYGKRAGPLRNEQMARDSGADACLVVWDGESRGSANMVEMAEKYGVYCLCVGPLMDNW